jgi:hypothetical protein
LVSSIRVTTFDARSLYSNVVEPYTINQIGSELYPHRTAVFCSNAHPALGFQAAIPESNPEK